MRGVGLLICWGLLTGCAAALPAVAVATGSMLVVGVLDDTDWKDYRLLHLGNAAFETENYYGCALCMASFLDANGTVVPRHLVETPERLQKFEDSLGSEAVDLAVQRCREQFYPLGYNQKTVALYRLAGSLYHLGQYDDARTTYKTFIREANQVHREKGNMPIVVQSSVSDAYRQMAMISMDMGAFRKALYYANRALDRHLSVGSNNAAGLDCRLMSTIYARMGCFDQAQAAAERALELHRKGDRVRSYKGRSAFARALLLGLPFSSEYGAVVESKSDLDLLLDQAQFADLAFLRGQFARSFRIRREVIVALENLGVTIPVALQKQALAQGLRKVGEQRRALAVYRDIETLYRSRGLKKRQFDLLLDIVDLAADTGDWKAAQVGSENAAALAKDFNSPYFDSRFAELKADVAFRQGAMVTAQKHYRRSLAFKRRGDSPYQVKELVLLDYLACLGNEVFPTGDYDIDHGLSQLPDPMLRWKLAYFRGRTYERRGDRRKGLTLFAKAVEDIERLRDNLHSIRQRTGFFRDRLAPYHSAVRGWFREGRPEEALRYLELSKARSFRDLMAVRALRQETAELRQIGEAIRFENQVHAYRSYHGGEYFSEQRLPRKFLEFRLDPPQTGETRDIQTIPILSPAVTLPDAPKEPIPAIGPSAIGPLRAMVPAGCVVIEYFYDDQGVIAFRITADLVRACAIDMQKDALRDLLAKHQGLLLSIDDGIAQSGAELYRSLLAPLNPGETNLLVVVPYGCLNGLSFATLHDGVDFIGRRRAIHYLPSLAIGPYIRGFRSRLAPMLAIGDPAEPNSTLSLPGARQEVLAIRIGRKDVFLGAEATESRVKSAAGMYASLHLATHAVFDPVHQSYVYLRGDAQNDGRLTMTEIANIDLDADLVVISSCQSAVGTVIAGEEVISLARAFLFAGTSAVVSSLWPVHDDATAILFQNFYGSLPDAAPWKAMHNAVRATSHVYSHPYFWAGFTCLGRL